MINFEHKPVLYDECIEYLNIKTNGIYVDGTLGGAGHSSGILSALSEEGILIGLDQDINAIKTARNRLDKIETKACFRIIHSNFENIRQILNEQKIKNINGALIDLGVSSHQLDEAERGFSYMHDGPLDMRMDTRSQLSAEQIVNEYTKDKITEIIRDYGEEKWAARIAEFIVKHRQQNRITSTMELSEIIKSAIPAGARRTGPHPAKRTFQAIRIEVNRELEILEQVINDFIDVLAPKGRLLIITFHSLEDRIVKKTFKKNENPCTCPPDFPICVCGNKPKIKVLNKKPIVSKIKELDENPRARSAKLRVVEKL